MEPQFVDMLEAIHRPQVARLQAQNARLQAVVDRLRGAIRDIHNDAAPKAYRHIGGRWILSLSEEVWSEIRHLSVATDAMIAGESAQGEPA